MLPITMGRPDGTIVKDIPSYRRMMPYFLKTKAESLTYHYPMIRAEKALEMADRLSVEMGEKVSIFPLVLHSLAKTLHAYPRSNRFVKGGRHYQRNGVWFSFSVKKEMTARSSISVVKREFKKEFTLQDTIRAAKATIRDGKDKRKVDPAEKETKSYLRFPSFLIKLGFPVYKFMDEHGLFSRSYVEKEPMYASAFLANVGSFNADAGYHHLYEIGTITLFLVIGKVQDMVVAENGVPVVRKILPVKVTFDERAEDGLYCSRGMDYFVDQIENPEKLLEPVTVMEK